MCCCCSDGGGWLAWHERSGGAGGGFDADAIIEAAVGMFGIVIGAVTTVSGGAASCTSSTKQPDGDGTITHVTLLNRKTTGSRDLISETQ